MVLSSLFFQLLCQVDSISIKSQIMDGSDSKYAMIYKGRLLLSDKFFANDFEAVKGIKNYLIKNVEDDNYVVFYPNDYWFILYWTQEYEELLNSFVTLDSIAKAIYNQRIPPPGDMLNAGLWLKSKENAEKIINQIQETDINVEKKEILRLTFEKLINNDSHQDILNNQVDIFLETYPETVYKVFAKKHISYKYVPKNFGFAIEFFTGRGVFTKTLKEDYSDSFLYGISIGICYKKFELYPRYYIGFNKTNREYNYPNGIFEKNSPNRVFYWETSLGYVIMENKTLKLSPFIGVGEMRISPPNSRIATNQALKELSYTSNVFPAGFNFDIKLGKEKYSFRAKSSYAFLRLRYSYIFTKFDKKYDFSGNMHTIILGIGGMERRLKREY